MIEIYNANNTSEFRAIEKLAKEILHEVYGPLIPAERLA